MQEASETQSWLEFSLACKYVRNELFEELDNGYEGIISMINDMERIEVGNQRSAQISRFLLQKWPDRAWLAWVAREKE